jgi:hypothetical protein
VERTARASLDAEAQLVGSFSSSTQVRAMGLDTDAWVRVRRIDPVLSGWVRRADVAELRR